MADVTIKLSFSPDDGPLLHARAYRWLCRALALWNYLMMPRWGLPPLYSSGVRYGTPPAQILPDALAIYRQKWADCGPLAAFRIAELWRRGERGPYPFAPWLGGADVRIYYRPVQGGRRLFHAQVRRGVRPVDGAKPRDIEDPSRLLGMKAAA